MRISDWSSDVCSSDLSGLLDWIRDASAQASAGSHRPSKDFRYYIGFVYVNVESNLIAAAYTTMVFLVRLLALCLTLPVYLIAAFVVLVVWLVLLDLASFGDGLGSGSTGRPSGWDI